MHLMSADLHLKRLSRRTHQCRMQRLVHIRLWHSDIILKSARNRCIHLVDHTQCRITVLDGIYYNTYSKQVINLVNCFILIHHFLIDTEEMLYPSVNIRINIRILNMIRYFLNNLLDKFFSFCLTCIDLIYQIIKHLWLQIF